MNYMNDFPEEMAAIARLPLSEQNDALRVHCFRSLKTSTGDLDGSPALPSSKENGPASPVVESCSACGAPADTPCASGCEANRA